MSSSGGGTARTSTSRFWPHRDHWVWWAQVRAAEEVAVLRVDARLLPVAAHGCAVVVWTRQPPRVTALDISGAEIGPVALRLPRSRRP